MKQHLQQLLTQAIQALQQDRIIANDVVYNIQIERARNPKYGNFASNIALKLAKSAQKPPLELAHLIINALPKSQQIFQVTATAPGFINFHINPASRYDIISQILQKQEKFGLTNAGQGKKVHIEYVSANPTGPLHVGHGRGAAIGSTIANLLIAVGYKVHREYYVNDAGRQMNILALSIWLRYLEACGETITFPSNAYQGEYICALAHELKNKYGAKFHHKATKIYQDTPDLTTLPIDEVQAQEIKEIHLDTLIQNVKNLLQADYNTIHEFGTKRIIKEIREDLTEFAVTYDEWFSENSLMQDGAIAKSIAALQTKDLIYTQDEATWFRSTKFGDEKDRVLIRKNGQTTYFASDVAYHWNKLARGYQIIINVFGADHHGYVARLKAALQALGLEHQALHIPLVQFAVLYRHGKKVQMSTRSGEFVTLRELRNEVSDDAARFFYIMRRTDQHMDFDLDLAKAKTNENPIYYVQYAHARICSVFRQMHTKQLSFNQTEGLATLIKLNSAHETNLIDLLNRYPETILQAATNLEPHLITNYLRELAAAFHIYYNAEQFLVTDTNIRNARLCLITAIKQVIYNALNLLGVSAPEVM